MSTVEQERLSLLSTVVEQVAGVPAEKVLPDQSFITDLGLDSLALVAIVYALEERTGADIAEEQLSGVRSVQDLLDLMPVPTESS